MTDIKKSINSVINERISSPLYGTLILTWIVWNWKIVYLTIFISENKMEVNKIDYIISNYSDINNLVYFPLISTLILLTIIPFLNNGAYWLSLNFNKLKSDKKNEVEKKQLLTLEQSIQLRELIAEQEKKFDNLLTDKNTEIKQLKLQIEEYTQEISKELTIANTSDKGNDSLIKDLTTKINENPELANAFETINYYIQGGYSGLQDKITSDSLGFFVSHDIIENKGKGMYTLTEIGKNLNRALLNKKFK